VAVLVLRRTVTRLRHERTTKMKRQKTHRHFPRQIARFQHLQGGQYGTLVLIALTDDTLELQLGGDFVQFTREQAEDLRDAVQKFLCLEEEEEERREYREEERAEEIAEEVVEVVEELLERAPASERPSEPPRRRKKARATT